MRRRRFQVRGERTIAAPPACVFDAATDAALIPLYAEEIARIDVLQPRQAIDGGGAQEATVRSILRLGWLRVSFRYRYRYRRPRLYAGVQQARMPLRGYFVFTFTPAPGEGTLVRHVEGLESRLPGLAWLAGTIYFRLTRRGDLGPELERLAALVAARAGQDGPR